MLWWKNISLWFKWKDKIWFYFIKYDLNEKIKTLATKEKIKILATKAELKSKQDEIVKLETYYLSFFIGQSYFNNDWVQLYLIFKPIYKTITTLFCLSYSISEWKPKGLSNEKFTPLYTVNKFFSPKLILIIL